jgi:AcrR family transcriptional regulator
MATRQSTLSVRHGELLESAYRYVLEHGIADLSLRPLAADIGSSPRVLLFLFGSKDGLIRALLARARADELDMLAGMDGGRDEVAGDLLVVAERVWSWLATPEHRSLLVLWVEAFARSLINPEGPWGEFARATVRDWLMVLAAAQPKAERQTSAGKAQRTLVLAVLRGALLDLLATGDVARTTAAVHRQLRSEAGLASDRKLTPSLRVTPAEEATWPDGTVTTSSTYVSASTVNATNEE